MEPTSQFAPRVLLAIDDIRLRRTNEAGLRAAGFAVSAPGDADAVAILAESFSPDVLIIDTSMNGPDNRPLYQRLRSETDRYMLCIDSAGRERHACRGLALRRRRRRLGSGDVRRDRRSLPRTAAPAARDPLRLGSGAAVDRRARPARDRLGSPRDPARRRRDPRNADRVLVARAPLPAPDRGRISHRPARVRVGSELGRRHARRRRPPVEPAAQARQRRPGPADRAHRARRRIPDQQRTARRRRGPRQHRHPDPGSQAPTDDTPTITARPSRLATATAPEHRRPFSARTRVRGEDRPALLLHCRRGGLLRLR